MLDQQNMKRVDLTNLMGGRARASQFFSGQRALSMRQLLELRALFGIPADLLVPEPDKRAVRQARTPVRDAT